MRREGERERDREIERDRQRERERQRKRKRHGSAGSLHFQPILLGSHRVRPSGRAGDVAQPLRTEKRLGSNRRQPATAGSEVLS